ncbi:CU044_2847 family protein [Streptomyces sp. NPDC046716]|uniref:CU044_2847 family protein n=1 Tax=Streptomyces sp. NPDC046716 TaxID=3157093 RepID=UPI0033F1085F
MPSEAVQFMLADGETSVLVSASDRASGSGTVSTGDRMRRAQQSLRSALAPITAAAAEVISEFRAHAERPEEIEVSFGVTLDASLGAVISSAKASTHLDVRLRWSGRRNDAPAA